MHVRLGTLWEMLHQELELLSGFLFALQLQQARPTQLHLGEVERLHGGGVAGLAVHIGARVASLARANEILTSQTVKDVVVGSGVSFADRGAHSLKGVPGEWRTYAVEG